MSYTEALRGPEMGRRTRTTAHGPLHPYGIVGTSRRIRAAVQQVQKLAHERPPHVLIIGAPGTGKGLFARALHHAGANVDQAFLSLDLRAAPARLIESELFGHEAHTFDPSTTTRPGLLELAGEGTLFLDDIEHLPPVLQPKLLKALEDRTVRRLGGTTEYEVRCTIVAASARPLEQLVAEGSFRDDLFRALNQHRLSLPSLLERDGDIVVLATHFLNEMVRNQGLLPLALADDAIVALTDYDWPGNVRELRAAIERAARVADGSVVHARHLEIQTRQMTPIAQMGPTSIELPPEGRTLADIERQVVALTVERCGGDLTAAARMLQIPLAELHERLYRNGTNGAASGKPAHRALLGA